MHLTVGICTWNRALLLDRTLAELARLHVPAGVTWEVLVVNNNSPDDTDCVLERHAKALPLRRLFQPVQGKSHAANMLAAEAAGEYVLWTDDDVLVDPEWMAAYVRAALEHSNGVFFGGTVCPLFESDPPAWLQRNFPRLSPTYAVRDFGPETRSLKPDEIPVGANMMVRTAELRRYPFDVRLGPTGRDPINGEETLLIQQLRADGHAGFWVGGAKLRHFIPAQRLTPAYLKTFYHWVGRGTAREHPDGPEIPRLRNVPRWLYRRHLASRMRSLALAPFRTDTWLDAYLAAAVTGGMIAEYRAGAK